VKVVAQVVVVVVASDKWVFVFFSLYVLFFFYCSTRFLFSRYLFTCGMVSKFFYFG